MDDLAVELSDRFGPLPDEARRLLDFAKLRCRAIDLGIDSITRHPGMIMIGHHDRERIDRLRQAPPRRAAWSGWSIRRPPSCHCTPAR